MEYKVKFYELPEKIQEEFRYEWRFNELSNRHHEYDTNLAGTNILKKILNMDVKWKDKSSNSFSDDEVTFKNEYEYMLCLLKYK